MPNLRCQGADAPKTTKKIVPIKNKPTREGEASPLVRSEKLIIAEANTIQKRESTFTPRDRPQSWGCHCFTTEPKKTFRTRR